MLVFKTIFFTCLVFLAFSGSAQNSEAEKIQKIIPSLKEDSTKVNTLIELGNAYLSTDVNEALMYGEEAKVLAEKLNYVKGKGFALKLIGVCFTRQGNYFEAIIQFKASLEAFEAIQFKSGISNMLSNLGSAYFIIGDDTQSIDSHLKSLSVAEEIVDKMRIATSLNNIGTVYSNKPATSDKALQYFLKALPLFKEINYDDGIGTVSVNIGEDYFKRGLYDSARNYLETSVKIYQRTPEAAYALSYLGEIYADEKNFEKAFSYHNQAIEITEKLGARFELMQSLISLAKTQKKEGNTSSAITTYKKAQLIGEEVRARQEVKIAYEALSKLYAEIGDFKDAYIYETLLTTIKDTLYNTAEDKKIQQLQFNSDIDKKQAEIGLLTKEKKLQKIISYATGASGLLLLIVAIGSYNRYKYVRRTNKIIQEERDRSKELLLNILPEETARELETNGHAQTRYYESVTVLFTDFKGFSTIAGKLSPQDLVAELNDYFGAFDEIVGQYNLEKIKTIGDAYMCAGGIPTPNDTNPINAVQAALAMQEYMAKKNATRKEKGLDVWELRVGIHTGPIVAGVVGKRKYAYDIWGDTVNIASRMESNGEAGKVNISDSTYQRIKEHYQCLYRGKISAKNIGEVDMYFIESTITKPALQLA